MKKTIHCVLGSLILLSFAAQGQEVDGLWLVPSQPGYNMTVVDGPANEPDEALGVSILGPDFTDWGIFYGINEGDAQNVSANLIPSITNSDMRARWTSSGLTGTLQIQSCTRNCPFAPGQTLQIVKEYGDGVYPEGEEPGASSQVEPGKWTGPGAVCLNIGEDGTTVTETGSSCENGTTFFSRLSGTNEDGGACIVEAACEDTWPIVDGKFECTVWNGESLVVGYFTSATTVSGVAVSRNPGLGSDVCVSTWTATPE